MSEEEKQRPQGDFFTDLMFGSPPRQNGSQNANSSPAESQAEQPSGEPDIEASSQESGSEQNQSQNQAIPDKQVEQMLALMQTLGPTIEKLAPLAGVVQTFFKNLNKNESKEKKKGANKS